MPVAVIMFDDGKNIPAIISEYTDQKLFERLCTLKPIPPLAKTDIETMKAWIKDQPAPSGWYKNHEVARTATAQLTAKNK